MKKLSALFLLTAALVLGAEQTFTGTITDSMCGGDHKAMNMGANDKCVTECVKAGAKYALWDGHQTYVLSDQAGAAKLAARKVIVKGTLDAKTKMITVASITAAK